MKRGTAARRQRVWCVVWDSGGSGQNGEDVVYLKGGKYLFSDDWGGEPLECEELLPVLEESGLNHVNDTTQSIRSPLFSTEQIVSMLEVEAEVGHNLNINGEEWLCVAPGVLQRAEPDSGQ